MEEISCKRSCAQCTYRAKLNCTGCRAEPNRPPMGLCEVYRCAKGRGYEHCGQCGGASDCTWRNTTNIGYQAVLQANQNAFLGKWLMVLFLLFIPNTIGSFLSGDSIKEAAPGLFYIGELLSFASQIIYGVVLLNISRMAQGYSTAGVCTLITTCIDGFIIFVVGATELPLLVSLIIAVIGLVGMYNEYMGHATVLYQSNKVLSAKWTSLWNWTMGLNVAVIVCPVLAFVIPLLGVLGLLASVIGLLVVMIVKLVYLWESASYFRN